MRQLKNPLIINRHNDALVRILSTEAKARDKAHFAILDAMADEFNAFKLIKINTPDRATKAYIQSFMDALLEMIDGEIDARNIDFNESLEAAEKRHATTRIKVASLADTRMALEVARKARLASQAKASRKAA